MSNDPAGSDDASEQLPPPFGSSLPQDALPPVTERPSLWASADEPAIGSDVAPLPVDPVGAFDAPVARSESAAEPIEVSPPAAPAASYYDDPAERYADVPASLELSYTDADLGLGPRAYERAYPYEVVQKRRRHTAGTRYRRVGRELAETLILALLIFFAVKAVIQNFRVEGASMEPTMHNNDYLLVNKALYFRFDTGRLHDFLPFVPDSTSSDRHLFRPPRRGDVVVFRFPLDPSRDFIKRVIGVPGDTVEVKDEKVYINGSPLKEDYILATPNYTYGPKTVPVDMYFVLGDNRRNSFDSHAWGNSCSAQQQCDFVPEENIIGQAWVAYWPFDSLGLVHNEDIKPQAP